MAQHINYLGIEQGLSNNAVTCIYRDHYGFMWMGTYDGLNRYDGNSFMIFKNKWGDTSSLVNNHINTITEDKNNRIWIGTDKGLVIYDYSNSRIYQVYYRSAADHKIKKINSRINVLKTGADGSVFIATSNGLLLCKNGDNVCRQVNCGNKSENYYVQALTIDQRNRVWTFILGYGLSVYSAQLNNVTLVNRELKGLACMTADQTDENLWMGSERALFKYNIAQHSLTDLSNTYKLSNYNVMQIYPDKHGQLWLATDGGGVNIINTLTNKVSYIGTGENKGGLSSGAVYAIYEDPDSRKWIATLRGGINIIDDKKHQFRTIANNPLNANSLINNFTRSFCEDDDHNIWIGTSGGGLSYWNPRLNTYQNFTHQEGNPRSLSSDFIFSIIEDSQKNIWIGTFNGGIDRFDKQSRTFKHYSCYNSATLSEDHSIWKIYEDSHHNVWAAATRGGAVYLLNRTNDKFELYDKALENITAIYEDKAGVLWMANTDLFRVDALHKKRVRIPVNASIHALFEDKNHNFWMGTDGGGLLLFNRANNKITRYTENDGLPSNTILNILDDDSGDIWFSTFNGLCKFNSATKKFKSYFASDDLQSNQFNFNAALKLRSGELLFGGIKGFNKFYPDSIKTDIRVPQVYLTGFKVNNVAIEKDSSFKGSHNIIDMQKITLDYDKAVIAVDYVAPEYSFPDKINYAYYLEGWDHAWNEVGKLRTAYYSRLNEGHYILRIKSTNTDGVWSSGQRLVYITVLPPWYRTWWAYLSYCAMLTTLAYLFWLYRTRQTRLKHEIEITTIKAEKEREMNEKKLAFFTNISHEFRTPLTLIINPIKDLIHDTDSRNKQELNVIYRNARRLLGLVDHLLLFRKAESENDKLNIVKLNFVNLCNEVYQCFIQQAKSKKIQYDFECDARDIELYADREKIEIALFNLISNAIKYTPESGRISIVIKEEADAVYLEVADTGTGIAPDTGDRLCEKFYQIKGDRSLKTGFGIGLYLAKNFIERHGGSINYKSNVGGGTVFTIALKKGNQQFTEGPIFEDMPDAERHIHEMLNDAEEEQGKTGAEETSNLELLISDQQSLLVIDDNSEIREYIKKIFKTSYKVYDAANGTSGLEMIKKYMPDMVISDVMMDDLNGIELCKMIKQDSSLSHIPVILLTGDSTPDIKLRGIEVGAVDFVSKPFEKDLLMARVKSILKSKSDLQNYFYNEVTLKANSRNISEQHKDFLYSCIAVVENNLFDPDFDVKTIATEMGMSYSNLFKLIKQITGQSVNSFVRFVRLRKAAEMMINTNCNVNEAAFQAGFNDIKYFREQFNKQFGINPSEFIKKHRNAFHKSYKINY